MTWIPKPTDRGPWTGSPDAPSADLRLSRREFLAVSALALPALGSSCGDDDGAATGHVVAFDAAAVPESTSLFPRTVISGDVTPSSVRIAVFVADRAPKTLRVWQPGPEPATVQLVAERVVQPDADGFVKERIGGLAAGERYAYAFFDGDAARGFSARSLVGAVRTAPAEDSLAPVTIATGACVGRGTVLPDFVNAANPRPFFWELTRRAAALDYDCFVHLGDQGYMDLVWAAGATYEGYLAAWGAYHGGGFRDLFPRSGIYAVPDDHEAADDTTVDPWTTDPSERERIANALRAFYRVLPLAGDEPFRDPFWRSYRWGRTVELILLDSRYERDGGERIVSDAQLEFLLERLATSPCRFKCVATSTPFATVTRYPAPRGRWEGYPVQRERVKALVNERAVEGVVWITGDIHMCYVGRVELGGTTRADRMWEVCVTSGNVNPGALLLPPAQFDWVLSRPCIPLLTFDAARGEVTVRFVDETGATAHEQVIRPDA